MYARKCIANAGVSTRGKPRVRNAFLGMPNSAFGARCNIMLQQKDRDSSVICETFENGGR